LCAGRCSWGALEHVRCAHCGAISVIVWIADDPVPITATRLPVKSTPPSG
jgi:hypothetical protein